MITKFVLYLSGPMTGLPDLNYPAFRTAAKQLRDVGYIVVSPHEISPTHTPDPQWLDFMHADIEAFGRYRCNAIATLDGWSESQGARAEVGLGMGLKIPVQTVDKWLLQWEKHSEESVQPVLI